MGDDVADNNTGTGGTGGGDNIDVDALLNDIYGGGNRDGGSTPPPAATTPPPAPEFREYEFKANGQMIKLRDNDPRMQQYLSQGYNYAQNTEKLKADREAWERDRGTWEKDWNPYREIDQYAKQNPDWWQHVEQSYQQVHQQSTQQIDPVRQYLDQRLGGIEQDLPQMKQFLQEMQTQKLEAQRANEDAQLATAIKSIHEKHKDIDFAAKDESGLSLEHRVINHAVENGFPSFRAAFLDYYHDNLVQQAEARGKEAMMNQVKQRQKLGLLDDPTPSGQGHTAPNTSRKPASWFDPQLNADAILREMNFR